jgi:hypothetical protein
MDIGHGLSPSLLKVHTMLGSVAARGFSDVLTNPEAIGGGGGGAKFWQLSKTAVKI